MFVLGLTGSIGMGKSTTASFFAAAGVPVHDADATVHRLYEGEAVAAIEAAFPGTTADGKVDRDKLGRRVLGNAAMLERLEAIVHPLVRATEETFLVTAEASGAKVVVVSAPPDIQRIRAFERSGMTADKLAAILAKQMPDDEKRKRADFVLDTSQGFDAARTQVDAILRAVARMPKRRR
jgi:dephospho-CoA kinase